MGVSTRVDLQQAFVTKRLAFPVWGAKKRLKMIRHTNDPSAVYFKVSLPAFIIALSRVFTSENALQLTVVYGNTKVDLKY